MLLSFLGWEYRLLNDLSSNPSSRIGGMEGKPIVSPPAEHAANRPQCKQAEQAVERAQFCWFELNRVATRTFALNPKEMREDRTAIPAIPNIFPFHIWRLYERSFHVCGRGSRLTTTLRGLGLTAETGLDCGPQP